MLVVFGVGIEPNRPPADADRLDLAHLYQVVEDLVNGAKGDRRHGGTDPVVDGLGRRMSSIPVQSIENREPLGRKLTALTPVALNEGTRRVHRASD